MRNKKIIAYIFAFNILTIITIICTPNIRSRIIFTVLNKNIAITAHRYNLTFQQYPHFKIKEHFIIRRETSSRYNFWGRLEFWTFDDSIGRIYNFSMPQYLLLITFNIITFTGLYYNFQKR